MKQEGIIIEELRIANTQKISITNRSQGVITGVKDVLAFDVGEVLLDTELGMLQIKGSQLHMVRLMLEKGEVAFEGRIDSMAYSEMQGNNQGEGFFARLFK